VRLKPQPSRVLLLLVANAGVLVTRDELRSALWSDGTNVEFDQGLNYCISQIRAALGDSREQPTWIETIPKRGYRFVGEVRAIPEAVEAVESSPADQAGILALDGQPDPAVSAGQGTAPVSSARPVASQAFWGISAIVLLIAGGVYLASAVRPRSPAPQSILVKPFVPTGLTEEEAWYGDSLSQQVISLLAQGSKVKVLPFSTSVALKGKPDSVREIGKRYRVDAVMEGYVRRTGNRLHVSAQLVDTATERIIWSHENEREAADLTSIEASILSSIARALQLRVGGAETPASRKPPSDRETYHLYLRANVLSDQYGPDEKSAEIYREVIRRAPEFAPAHARLASLLARGAQGGLSGPALSAAKQAADRALQLDPNSAEAHTALAHVYLKAWKWQEAEAEFRTAVMLDPELPEARQLYGQFLATQGRFAEAMEQSDHAVQLAPTSALLWFYWSMVRLHAGRLDEAIEGAQRAVELDRGCVVADRVVARAYALQGMTAKALESVRDPARQVPNDNPELWQAMYLAQLGKQREALEMIRRWEATRKVEARPPVGFALALLAVGEAERGFEVLEDSVRKHVAGMLWLKVMPELAPYRNHERYRKAVALMEQGG
jgi:TolB-like protein/DNA-binding winged helix-turn-helix (wHTH) protein/Tfp pilus assembly protein PilF